jgi:hypothetical protein
VSVRKSVNGYLYVRVSLSENAMVFPSVTVRAAFRRPASTAQIRNPASPVSRCAHGVVCYLSRLLTVSLPSHHGRPGRWSEHETEEPAANCVLPQAALPELQAMSPYYWSQAVFCACALRQATREEHHLKLVIPVYGD